MLAEVIAIGSEFTSGAKLDTNSQWLSLQLSELGIATGWHTTIADDLESNVRAFQIAIERADVVLITGGLGPTLDDLTREALALATGTELELDPSALVHVESFFRSRSKQMPERNRIQAMRPAGSVCMHNPVGTAPGIWFELTSTSGHRCSLAAMPGVPSEMKKMFFEQVRTRLQGDGQLIRRARIHCFGLGESAVEQKLGDLTARGRNPEVGITAHEATITLRIIATADQEKTCSKMIAETSSQIIKILGDDVFGIEDDELEGILVQQAIQLGVSFSTVEIATNGLLAAKISHVMNSADCYRGGIVLPRQAENFELIINRLREESQADYLLVVGPETVIDQGMQPPISEIPLSLIQSGSAPQQHLLSWQGNPDITKIKAAKNAMDWLRRVLLEEIRSRESGESE